MHGGVKFYRGSASAARSYVEADHSRADDYYLAEGAGVAERFVATIPEGPGGRGVPTLQSGGTLDGDAYERWVAGYDVVTGTAKGRLRDDSHALRFVEVVVNGPKSWSLAAALHPQIATAYDAAMDRAAGEVIGWVAEHATTRVWPRGRQVQVPIPRLEAAVVRHYTSRTGDPHRHLHVQINARVFARGAWRGLHSVGVVDSIEAINGIGHAAVTCDPDFRRVIAAHGYTLADDGEIQQLVPFAGRFSQRAAQMNRNADRYEAAWRFEHPGQEPGPRLLNAWDRRAWVDARPDTVVPRDGAAMVHAWTDELRALGFTPPVAAVPEPIRSVCRLDGDLAADLVLTRLGAKRPHGTWPTSAGRSNVWSRPSVWSQDQPSGKSWSRTSPPERTRGAYRCWISKTYHVEIAFATTAYGAQGETVDSAHLAIGDTSGAASAYVGMTRDRHRNTVHLVAASVEDARRQWVEVFNRDRADPGPEHAGQRAAANIERYGPAVRPSASGLHAAVLEDPARHHSRTIPSPMPTLDPPRR